MNSKEDEKSMFAYIHADDFHLPSIFYTPFDYASQEKEFASAIELLSAIEPNYYGNIVADLSAQYCDNCLRDFFDICKNNKKNVTFIVTADHGYPLLQDPIRDVVYNQTYKDAFHIPFLVFSTDSNIVQQESHDLLSSVDALAIIKKLYKDPSSSTSVSEFRRDFVLCEYAGPGCPDIWKKDLWFTYIDKNNRASFECPISETTQKDHCVDFFDLQADPAELFSLKKNLNKCENFDSILDVVNYRRDDIYHKNTSKEQFIKQNSLRNLF